MTHHTSRSSAPDPGGEAARRHRMVQRQLVARGIRSPHVREAISRVRRESFVPEALRPYAYDARSSPRS